MRKILAAALLIVIAVSLVGCNAIYEWISDYPDTPGRNPTGNPDAEYWGYMILESDEDLSRGWEIYKSKQSENNTPHSKCYFFDDNAMDGYKTIYYFEAPNAWMVYPISIDDYFANANIIAEASYLINTADSYCQCGSTAHETVPHIPEAQRDYLKYPLISISKAKSLSSSEIIYLEDISLISVESSQNASKIYSYECSYDGTPAFVIKSCTQLSDSELNNLFEQIIVME